MVTYAYECYVLESNVFPEPISQRNTVEVVRKLGYFCLENVKKFQYSNDETTKTVSELGEKHFLENKVYFRRPFQGNRRGVSK